MSSILPILTILAISIHIVMLIIARLRFKLDGVFAQRLYITAVLCIVASLVCLGQMVA